MGKLDRPGPLRAVPGRRVLQLPLRERPPCYWHVWLIFTDDTPPLQPSPNATPSAEYFFEQYLAAPVVLVLYLFWKLYTRDWRFLVPIAEMDMLAGARLHDPEDLEDELPQKQSWFMRIARGLI